MALVQRKYTATSAPADLSRIVPSAAVVSYSGTFVVIGYDDSIPGTTETLDEYMGSLGFIWDDDAGKAIRMIAGDGSYKTFGINDNSRLVHVSKTGSDAGTGSVLSPFLTVQKGIDVASAGPWSSFDGAAVLVYPGTYDEDVVLKRSDVHIVGVGGQGAVKLKSLTVTDCTDASLAAFNASGDPTLLVQDSALTNPPSNNQLRSIEIERSANVPAWTGDAIASLRVLGGAMAGTGFLGSELLSWHLSVRQAAGAAAGKGGFYAAHVNYVSFEDSWVSGGCKTYQTAGLWFDFVTAVASPGGGVGTIEVFYDGTGALPQPSDPGNYGFNMNGGRVAKILLSGPAGRCGQDYLEGATIGEIDCDATSAASASILSNCHVKGAIDIAAVGPSIVFNGGRYMVLPTGLGAVGFVGTPGFNS